MEFIVKKVSDGFHVTKPCEEAYKILIEHIQEHNLSSFEEYDATWGEFTDTGVNHRVNERGNIERAIPEFDKKMWVVDISTLDELLSFKKKYGVVIIGESKKNYHYNEITIYDSWLK